MSISSNSARVFLCLSIALMFLSACDFSKKNDHKTQTVKWNTFTHQLPSSSHVKNSYLIDYQKNKLKKYSTNNFKDSTNVIELALKDQSKPIMTFVQYSY
jgi:outer membrane lipopolysaccharide assembly protein LptE/RlpB